MKTSILATLGLLLALPTLTWAQNSPGDQKEFGSIDFIWCPAGQFTMGSPSNEKDRSSDEISHSVSFSSGFWLGKCEVTQEEYERITKSNPSHNRSPKLPVENLTWNEANEFIAMLNQKHGAELPDGYRFALPTEAQWEYACRAGSSSTQPADGMRDRAWFKDNSQGSTKLPGQKSANRWGLCDINGNVWEWCQDWYGPYSNSTETDPTGSSFGKSRVYRGGSFGSFAKHCRPAYRGKIRPGFRDRFIGIRLAIVSG